MLSYVCTPLTPSPSPHDPRKGASLSPPHPNCMESRAWPGITPLPSRCGSLPQGRPLAQTSQPLTLGHSH